MVYRQRWEYADIQFKRNLVSGHSFTEEQTEIPSMLHLKETHRTSAPSVSLEHGCLSLANCFTTSWLTGKHNNTDWDQISWYTPSTEPNVGSRDTAAVKCIDCKSLEIVKDSGIISANVCMLTIILLNGPMGATLGKHWSAWEINCSLVELAFSLQDPWGYQGVCSFIQQMFIEHMLGTKVLPSYYPGIPNWSEDSIA